MSWFSNKEVVLQGCGQFEIFSMQLNVILGLLCRNALTPWIAPKEGFNHNRRQFWFKFAIDFLLLCMPTLLSMTVFGNHLNLLNLILFSIFALSMLFIYLEYRKNPRSTPLDKLLDMEIDTHYWPTMHITYARSLILTVVAIAILGVDFDEAFPRKFAKTHSYGHSLMDVGVALFIGAASFGSRLKTAQMKEVQKKKKATSRVWWLTSPYFMLPFIGFARTFLLQLLHYGHDVTEYGEHWNFFFSLAAITVSFVPDIITKLILPADHSIEIAVVLCLAHHILLNLFGVEDFILNQANPRNTLILANIEGIVSLIGYLIIYYFSRAVGDHISETDNRIISWLGVNGRLYLITFMFFLFQLASEATLGPPSRRVANVSYCFAQACLVIFSCACFMTVQIFTLMAHAAKIPQFSKDDNPYCGTQPCLCDSINTFGLVYFLLANIMTGLVNMTFDTSGASTWTGVFMLTIYMLILSIIVHIGHTFFQKRTQTYPILGK